MLRFYSRPSPNRARVAVLTIVSLLGSPLAPLVVAQAPPAARPAGTAAPAPPDGGWPRAYTTASGGTLAIYQPQVSSWVNQKQVVLYAAVSYTAKGAAMPALGTVKVESNTSVALDERLVSFSDFKIAEPKFPTLQRDQLRTVVEELTASVPLEERVIALDRVLANIDTSQIVPKNVEGVKADPPPIFFSKTPALLVNIDSDPIWAPIPQNDLSTAVNTNWDLFQHGPTKTFYLRNDKVWLKATDVKGPWAPAGTLPESFMKLPADDNWKEVKASLPGQKVSASQVPKVFVSMQPAELILLRGEPAYLAVPGTKDLLWVSNTDADVFRMGLKGAVYFLVAGRWFSAADFTGPWTFATTNLPADFKQISLEHPRSRVLASVPGTQQAAEAILLAQIPQTARVSKTLQAPEVAYQGTPEFLPIETTTVQRAVNTDKDILKVGDLYYMCFQGVWFMSRTPEGPWTVTGEVPKQIYEIPVSSPSHAVTYVTVEESNNDAVVFATAAAFTGMMVAWGCVVWGNGYYYPPYVGYGGFYPYYRPYYPTYGFGASYNPWTGAYTRGAAVYGPYGGAGAAQRYNPRTGTYSRGAVAYGPYGARGAASAYNPRTGTSAATRQGSNVYGSWGATGVQRGDDWATTARRTNNITDTTTRTTRTSEGGASVSRSGDNGRSTVAKTGSGDVYAGHDGNVYRKQGDSWQKYGEGGWSGVEQPTPQQRQQAQDRAAQTGAQGGNRAATSSWDQATAGQVNRDSAARAEGAQRTRESGQVQSGTSQRSRQLSRERRSTSGWRRATPLRRARRSATRRCATLVLLLMPVCASAQELEPGAYWPIPKGINIVTVANNFNWGDLAFDPAAPIEDASARINTTAFVFTGTFSLAGRSANAGVVVPVVSGHLEGLYLGEFAEADRFGLGDPRLRLAMNLYGAPAMTPQEYASYRQRGIVGISITVALPLGQYDSTKLINLGTNRWSIRPELGVSRTYGQWVVEMMAGVWLFTDNAEFVGGRTRVQDPIGATQFHVTYKFKPSMWLAADANYFAGGRTTIGGTENADLQRNSRIGATFSSALDRRSAIRIAVSRGAYTTIGADFTSLAASYNYAWTR